MHIVHIFETKFSELPVHMCTHKKHVVVKIIIKFHGTNFIIKSASFVRSFFILTFFFCSWKRFFVICCSRKTNFSFNGFLSFL
jgi:hypothetical protein